MGDPTKTTDQLRADLAFRLRIYLRVLEKGAPEVIIANEHRIVTTASEQLLERLKAERIAETN